MKLVYYMENTDNWCNRGAFGSPETVWESGNKLTPVLTSRGFTVHSLIKRAGGLKLGSKW